MRSGLRACKADMSVPVSQPSSDLDLMEDRFGGC